LEFGIDDKQVNYHYDASGMRTATQLFSQGSEVVTTSQAYDGMGRLTQIRHGDIAQYDYSWDAANRITSMNDAQYGYDATSQLTSAVYEKLPEPVRPDELYEYDANGNRKNFATGKNNQLTSDGVFRYTYDDEGNRVSKVSKNSKTEYVWDHRNRLIEVVDNGKSVGYDYDYLNRLVRRNDELFIHDGWQIACSLRNGKVEHRYLWGATQDELLAMDDAWTLRDHLNTVRTVVDARGCVISNLEYNAFGVLINATGDKPLFRYTGKMFDDATGLQWNVNRWYDANVGRWISEDPIGFEAGDASLYRYAINMPHARLDPLGLTSKPPCDPDTVTLYDDKDSASTDFKCAAKGLDGKPLPMGGKGMNAVMNHSNENHCCIKNFHLIDHGYTSKPGTQQVGDKEFSVADALLLCSSLCEDATVTLYGCNVGEKDDGTIQILLDACGDKIKELKACTGAVHYPPHSPLIKDPVCCKDNPPKHSKGIITCEGEEKDFKKPNG